MGRIITFWQNWIVCKKKIGRELDKLQEEKREKFAKKKRKKLSRK